MARVVRDSMKWQILINPEAFQFLNDLGETTADPIYYFLGQYLPTVPDPGELTDPKNKVLKGLCAFSVDTSSGMMRIFTHIDNVTKKILILHVQPRNRVSDKKKRKKSSSLRNKKR